MSEYIDVVSLACVISMFTSSIRSASNSSTCNLNFNLGNIIKYTLRCGKKDEAIKELEKIKQYADFEIQRLNNIQN